MFDKISVFARQKMKGIKQRWRDFINLIKFNFNDFKLMLKIKKSEIMFHDGFFKKQKIFLITFSF